MESRVIALGQQQQQIQAGDFASLTRGMVFAVRGVGDLVEGEELLVVAYEGVGLLEADGEEGAGLERLPREGEDGRGGRGRGD